MLDRPSALRLLPLLIALVPACRSVDEPGATAFADRGDAAASAPARELPYGGPPPTENWLQDGAEKVQKKRRKAWFEERHRTPPDVDWKAIERGNGLASTRRRTRLAPLSAAATGQWTERGSDNNAGRMHVAVPSADGTELVAGSSKGGVWRGNPDGTGWTPIGDDLYGGAHWLAVVPGAQAGAPDVVVAATDGGLVHRSTDNGSTWSVPAGLPDTSSVRRLLVTSDGSNAIFLLARAQVGGSNRYRLYRSTDSGASFAQVHDLGNFRGDLWAPRTGDGTLWLLDGDVRRSTDGGDTWPVLSALPNGTSGGELTGSEAGAPRLWAILDRSGGEELHRSDDAGASWSFTMQVTDYWGTLNASIVDAERMAWGGVEVHYTTNAGGSFDIVNPWYEYYGEEATRLHADIPGLDVVPGGPEGEIWYISTDGGLFHSLDRLESVANLSLDGLRVGQYYSTLTLPWDPEFIAAGSQDQGYQWAHTPAGPSGTKSFDQLISGDYGHLTRSDGGAPLIYSTYPGFILVAKNDSATPKLFQEDFPAGENYAWMPPVVADPYAAQSFFFCATQLWIYEKISGQNDWVPSLWSSQDFEASGGEYLSALVFSPVDPERAYASTNRGRLFTSYDHGLTWTQSADLGPDGHYFYGAALLASATDVDTAWIGGSGYGPPAVYRTTDGGVTWEPWNDGMPQTLVYSLAEAPDGSGDLYAGTETGVLRRRSGSALWSDVAGVEAPVTTYWSAESVALTNTIRFGTYGRGIWDVSADETCRYEIYGASASPFQILTLDSASDAFVGQNHRIDLAGGLPFATGWLVIGFQDAYDDLLFEKLLVDPTGALVVPIVVDGAGELALDLAIPADPPFVGLGLYFQAVLAHPPLLFGHAFSNGLAVRFCQ